MEASRRIRFLQPFIWILGLLSCSVFIILAIHPVSGPVIIEGETPATFLLFLFFGLCLRFFAFEIYGGVSLSLDSTFYIASLLTLGALPAALLVSLCLGIDTLQRTLRAQRKPYSRIGLKMWLGRTLLSSGTAGLTILVLGFIFSTDSLRQRLSEDPKNAYLVILLWVPILTIAFILLHYPVAGGRLWLSGFPGREILRKVFLFGLYVEGALIPLSMVLVAVYNPGNPFNFLLLGLTLLLINLVFRALSKTRNKLESRVGELETLREIGHVINATLDLDNLCKWISQETLKVMAGAELFRLSLWEDKKKAYVTQIFYPDQTSSKGFSIYKLEGLGGEVIETGEALLLKDLLQEEECRESRRAAQEEGIRSWLGIPLIAQDRVIGVMSVQSKAPEAFSSDQLHLFESIGKQAAVAIQNAHLFELATMDGLTRIYARRYFDQRILEEWERSIRYGEPFSLMLLDIDDFKSFNDRYGHLIGDRVLREVAALIRWNLRNIDIPARYGGEEFVVILPKIGLENAISVAERIRKDIGRLAVPTRKTSLKLTVSIGVSSYPENGCKSALEMLELTDQALYKAKDGGKNRVFSFPECS